MRSSNPDTGTADDTAAYRLPTTVLPRHYRLTLAPDLGDKVLAALAHPPSLQPATPLPSNTATPGVATPPWNR